MSSDFFFFRIQDNSPKGQMTVLAHALIMVVSIIIRNLIELDIIFVADQASQWHIARGFYGCPEPPPSPTAMIFFNLLS